MKKARFSNTEKAPTIRDVARVAGVSPMTVSRVVNDDIKVRSATRAKVKAAIQSTRYSPNNAARMLAIGRRVRFGVIYDNPSDGFLSEVMLGALEQATQRDIQLVIERQPFGETSHLSVKHLIDSGVDGIVLTAPLCESELLLELVAGSGVPCVMIAPGRFIDGVSAVKIEDHDAAFQMTKHILSLGHRRIGFICGAANQSSSEQRRLGYQEALRLSGVAYDDRLIAEGSYTYLSGLQAAEYLIDLECRPTAIFAANDDMAAAAVAVAHRRNLSIPEDLTICGFDDTLMSRAIWPQLTTIRQPIIDMARTAVEMLVTIIGGRMPANTEAHRILSFELIRRQSDGPPSV